MSERNTMSAIFAQPAGDKENPSWVNGPFDAVLSNPQMRSPKNGGNPFFTCMLADPANPACALSATFFGQVVPIPAGMVEVSGQGMQLGEYQGKKQISAGSKAKITPVGTPGLPGPIGTPVPNQVPANASYRAPAAPSTQGAPIHGASVGMAVNNAKDILLNLHHQDASFFHSSEFGKELFQIASSILRVSQYLEKGNLAPKEGERVEQGLPGFQVPAPVPPAPAPVVERPQPGPDGSVGDLGLEPFDVPF